jgi:polyhydroxyalkanoate synthesis regulator phasin
MDEPADAQQSASLRELAQDVLLAAVGAAALTREKADQIADELVRRGKLTREDARRLADELVAGPKGDGRHLTERAGTSLGGLFRELGLVGERRHEELELRVAQLEHRLRLVEARLGERSATPPEQA